MSEGPVQDATTAPAYMRPKEPEPTPPIDKLVEALAAAQGELVTPKKSKTAKIRTNDGKSYEYSYASLDDIVSAIVAVFPKHGLAFTQDAAAGPGYVTVRLRLLHASGQVLEFSPFTLPVSDKAGPQQYGSALTYARRYQITSALGIAAELDDDGIAAQHVAEAGTTGDTSGKATQKQHAALHALAARKGRTYENLRDWAGENLGIESLSELTKAGAARMMELLEARPDVEAPASPSDDTTAVTT